jgi:cytochrome c biogenesis protein CcmG, thiol:disulfide interchange protein DsbE
VRWGAAGRGVGAAGAGGLALPAMSGVGIRPLPTANVRLRPPAPAAPTPRPAAPQRSPGLSRGCDVFVHGRLVRIAFGLFFLLLALLAAMTTYVPGSSHILPAAGAGEVPRFVPWRGETPALSLKDLDGQVRSLADYRGKVLLINFWATWCEPCREEMPSMRTLRDKLAGRPFEVLVVNHGESATRVRDFLAKEKLELVALLDPNKDAARAWRVRVLPGSFLVDVEGRARYSVIGELDWATDEALAIVRGLLPATTTPGGRGGR